MAASTLTEVARLAGVSPATASRVLNGSARIPGKDIAVRVRQAAESLGYIPNAQAQGLAKSSSGLIGLIVHDIADPYFSAIARGVQEAAREQHKMVLLATTEGAPESEKEAVGAFAARRADSIVIAGSRTSRVEDRDGNAELAAELDRYCRNGGHVGVIGHGIVGATAADGYHVVSVPNEELAAQLATELAASREDFVIIGGPEGLFTSDDRIRGFQRGLAVAGLPAADVIRTDFNRAGGFEAGLALAARITASQPRTETKRLCIFAVNDVMAIGAAAALRSQGLRVPRDAAVAGFDDIETLRDFRPALSTVHLSLEEIGRQAASRAAGPSADDAGSPPITGQVILRRSTEVAHPSSAES
ncbi:LacI family DNA-binding transcriptional regulator [Pseudarthrobacter sp. AL07]|uniref:LacI family DNA-binding transcriptional regulator n=1 Tax=unclassified Pseudarthrobacter TaxID=2647000 RepID=UPI00249C4803|nr:MULTISPECIES: LacI family DNA-binding transcriptional regulator [unclassified Pseudarthrobacter]MDI3195141.1 LacI family DNA-binding transcriptional regulator [Pseudarthrobacter sp. AL20]MDI3209207.1 LacI family DNA-binding transcriptional regulator [Pseudarthrobacter sp. AL07]